MVESDVVAAGSMPKETDEAESRRSWDADVLRCPECGSTEIVEENEGEMVCRECGRVLEEEIIDASGPRTFSTEDWERRARSGAALTYTRRDKGLSTEIGTASELSKVPGKKRGQYYRIREWHRRATQSDDRSLGFALSQLKQMVSSLGLPKAVHEEVARLYEKAVQEGVVKGRRTEHILGALTYVVARNHGSPRPLEEIAKEVGADKREVGKAYRYAARELGLEVRPARPEEYIPRFSSELDASGTVQARARQMILDAREKDLLSGRGPTGIAGAALYLAAMLEGEEWTQEKVADTVGVTPVTIRNRSQEFIKGLDLAMDS